MQGYLGQCNGRTRKNSGGIVAVDLFVWFVELNGNDFHLFFILLKIKGKERAINDQLYYDDLQRVRYYLVLALTDKLATHAGKHCRTNSTLALSS